MPLASPGAIRGCFLLTRTGPPSRIPRPKGRQHAGRRASLQCDRGFLTLGLARARRATQRDSSRVSFLHAAPRRRIASPDRPALGGVNTGDVRTQKAVPSFHQGDRRPPREAHQLRDGAARRRHRLLDPRPRLEHLPPALRGDPRPRGAERTLRPEQIVHVVMSECATAEPNRLIAARRRRGLIPR